MTDPRDVVANFWAQMATNDFHAAAMCLSEDFEGHWPQSGEIIRGRANFGAVNTAYPAQGLWRFTVKRLVAEGDQVVTDVDITDGAMQATALTFHTIENGLITHQTEYWPDPFDAPNWRAGYVTKT